MLGYVNNFHRRINQYNSIHSYETIYYSKSSLLSLRQYMNTKGKDMYQNEIGVQSPIGYWDPLGIT